MAAQLHAPAVLLNCQITGIGMLQSLGLANVDVVTLEQDWPPLLYLGRYSRIPKQRAFYHPSRGERLVDSLLALSERFEGKGVLFPNTDQDLEEIIDGYDRLSGRYHVPVSKEIGHLVFDKDWQYAIAERVGMPLPRYTRFAGGERPELASLGFPLIIKPSSRASVAGPYVFRLRIVRNEAELNGCLDETARDHPGRAFQAAEIIPGGPEHLYTIGSYSNRSGRVLRSYSGRKLTQFPYDHGSVSIAETTAVPAQVIEQSQALLHETRIHGMTQVELKLDPRDGQYKLIEINDRGWLWVKLAAFSGVNLPLIQYYDLTDDPRLEQALAQPQEDDRFFVFDFHVKMNDLPSERLLLREMMRTKKMVPAVYHRGEWLLNAAYWLNSALRRAKRSLIGQPPREQQYVRSEG